MAQELTVGGAWGGRPKEGSVLALNKNNNEDGDSNSHDKTGFAVSSRKPPNNNGHLLHSCGKDVWRQAVHSFHFGP